jgi:hypothetical protein
MMNKFHPHVYVIPEDRADAQLANGFVNHHAVRSARMQVMPEAGGWRNVLKEFRDEYVGTLRAYPQAHVVMLIDFDGHFDQRRREFDEAIPVDLKMRVFVLGPKHTPQVLKGAIKEDFESIGRALANDCDANSTLLWGHEQLVHNDPDRLRLTQIVRPFLF